METETHSITMSKILEISENSYFRWKKKDHVVLVNLLEKYFTKEDLKEFLESGKIKKMENLNLVHTTAKKIVKEFFYTSYTNERKNDEFFNIIFPSYIKFENQQVEKNKKILQDRIEAALSDERKKAISNKIDNIYTIYNKRDLIKFIIDSELNIDKTSALLEISYLSDFEIHLLINEYKKFVRCDII